MGSTVAEVSLTEAHVDLLVPVLDVGAPLLAVTGCPGHALSLRGNPVVLPPDAINADPLYDLGAPAGAAGSLVHCRLVGRLLPVLWGVERGRGGPYEGVPAVAPHPPGPAGVAPPEGGVWIVLGQGEGRQEEGDQHRGGPHHPGDRAWDWADTENTVSISETN